MTQKLLSDEELCEKLEDIAEYLGCNDMELKNEIIPLINTQKRLYAESEYQTYIYKQNHPRLEAKGVEIWGIRIAYQGQCIYGDIAGSKEEAEEKLANELSELRAEQRARIK